MNTNRAAVSAIVIAMILAGRTAAQTTAPAGPPGAPGVLIQRDLGPVGIAGDPGTAGSGRGTLANPGRGGAASINWAQLQRQLHATDEDWKVLGPKIARVVAARASLNNPSSNAVLTDMAGPGRAATVPPPAGGLTGPAAGSTAQAATTTRPANDGGSGAGGPGNNQSVGSALSDLRSTLSDNKADTTQISDRLTALRVQREKAKAELQAAVDDLMPHLTADQEATLVVMGYLD
jgi:hypothetical protein